MQNLYLGQDLFFLGFPYGMFTPDKGLANQKFPIPFVKKGILSAIQKENKVTVIYIDAHNNNGFSGGPIITIDSENQVQIIGVNTSYLKHDNVIDYEEYDDDGNPYEEIFEYYENSGLMHAHGINHVLEIIENCS